MTFFSELQRPARRDSFSRAAQLAPASRSASEVNRSALDVNRSALEVNRSAFEVNRSASEVNRLASEVYRSALEVNRSASEAYIFNGYQPASSSLSPMGDRTPPPTVVTVRLTSEPPPDSTRNRWSQGGGGGLRPSTSESQLHVRGTVARINAALKQQQQVWNAKPVEDDKENPFKAMLSKDRPVQLAQHPQQQQQQQQHQPQRHYSPSCSRTLPSPPPQPSSHLFNQARCVSAVGFAPESSGARAKRSQSLEPEIVMGRPPPAYRPSQSLSSGGASRSSSTEPEVYQRACRAPSLSPTKPNPFATWREDDAARAQPDQRISGRLQNKCSVLHDQ